MSTINPLNRPAIVRQAEQSEQQLIEAAKSALAKETDCRWEVGRLAHEWTRKHASGRTDADFAELIGISREQVTQRRLTFKAFGHVRNTYYKLSWSHFNVAINWSDAKEWFARAEKDDWSVSTMKHCRKLNWTEEDQAGYEASKTGIENCLRKTVRGWLAMKRMRDGGLYRDKYRTFDEFVIQRFAITPEAAALRIANSEVIVALATESEFESANAENRPIQFRNEGDRHEALKLMGAYFSD